MKSGTPERVETCVEIVGRYWTKSAPRTSPGSEPRPPTTAPTRIRIESRHVKLGGVGGGVESGGGNGRRGAPRTSRGGEPRPPTTAPTRIRIESRNVKLSGLTMLPWIASSEPATPA